MAQSNSGTPSRWNAFDTMWMLNLFGTAVGAGILFLPIKAGMSGVWPLVLITLITGPMIYLAHLGLTRFVLSSAKPGSDITDVVEEHFGVGAGKLITVLYFFAIYPILLIYGVGITNTVGSFLVNQLGMASLAPALEPWTFSRLILSGVLVGAMILVIVVGESFVLKFNEKLVYPLCAILFCLSLYLIPKWNTSMFAEVPGPADFASTIWLTLPVLVFAFNHSPAISSFAMAQQHQYGDNAGVKSQATLRNTAGILVLFVMFFVFSCVFSLTPQDLVAAKQQNIPVLSYLANRFDNPVISYFGPLIAFLAIATSFFGHYLGAREGLHGILHKCLRDSGKSYNPARLNRGLTIFFFVSIWIVATINPSILGMIETLGGPIIAMILFIMPMYAIRRVPAMRKFQGRASNVFVTVMGLITIASLIGTILF